MNILNLPAWSVLDTREADHDYHITVQLTYPPSYCPHCGAVANLQGYGGKEQLFLDLPIQMKRVAILVQRRRFKCIVEYSCSHKLLPLFQCAPLGQRIGQRRNILVTCAQGMGRAALVEIDL